MKYKFDYSFIKRKRIISLSKFGIRINGPVLSFLLNAGEVMIGYDKEKSAICLAPWDGDEGIAHYKIKKNPGEKNSGGTIYCRKAIKFLSSELGMAFTSRAKSFRAMFDNDRSMAIVIVKRNRVRSGENVI